MTNVSIIHPSFSLTTLLFFPKPLMGLAVMRNRIEQIRPCMHLAESTIYASLNEPLSLLAEPVHSELWLRCFSLLHVIFITALTVNNTLFIVL